MKRLTILINVLGLLIALYVCAATVNKEYGATAASVAVFALGTVAASGFVQSAIGGQTFGVTISSSLKLDAILDSALEAFAKSILPLTAFSTVFNDVMLKGTNKVVVPYYPLETATSKDYNGTYLFDDGSHESREVTVNKRKYQSLAMSSAEIARQPFLNAEELGRQKGRKLAQDVIADILSLVTLSNYGEHVFAGASSGFDVDEVADIRTLLNQAEWPLVGRGLVLDSAYDGALVKDDPLLHAHISGSADQLRTGKVKPFMGFERYFATEMIPGNSEHLVGFAVYPSAILTAFSPIEPADDVRATMTDYRAVTDPESGITLEYRQWGDPNTDTSRRVIEVNYGYAKGEGAALKRIVSQAPL